MMKKVSIQLIRNATLKINYCEKVFLVDPMLGERNTFMSFVQPNENLNPTVDLPLPVEEIVAGTDAVLLTHGHPDHIDEAALKALPSTLPLFAQSFDQKLLEESPFSAINYVETCTGYGNVTIRKTKGKHGPDALLETLGEVSGFILSAPNLPTIYIVGDCLLDAEIEQTIETYNPDIIITNSGGAQFMGEHRILMNAEDTINIAKKVPHASIIAVHLEAIDHCPETRHSIQEKATENQVTIFTPKDGEVIEF